MAETRTISTLNGATQTAGATTNLKLSTGRPLKIFRIDGFCNGSSGTAYYLQLHNAATIPSNTAVPLRSWQIGGANGFNFVFTPNGLNTDRLSATINTGNLVLVLSTTEATLTVGTGNITMDVEVDVEEYDIRRLGLTTSGDTTTAVATLQVVADAINNTNKLYEVTAKNNSGATEYLILFAKDSPADGTKPIQEWTATTGTTLSLKFGDGLFIKSTDADETDDTVATVHTGISLFVSSTPAILTASSAGWTIQAKYL